ncbi:hypothetical protein KP509_30G046100 [Ceratopteris richardii]|uniref:AP2/ERF domain-containing protein n=1 Tax=Ceratopteris richardii TaxID=49495 RepID=A0A8T2R268_CERRI|nr:hypothetical protein KP509_30G046100 [Ceratopteris richardii]
MTSSSSPSTTHGGGRRSSRQRAPRFRGVRRRNWGSWVAEIRIPNTRERLWLGSYRSIFQAARAYDVATLCLRGPSPGRLNLPNLPAPPGVSTNLSVPAVRDLAAQEALRLIRPTNSNAAAVSDESNNSSSRCHRGELCSDLPSTSPHAPPTAADLGCVSSSTEGVPPQNNCSDAHGYATANEESLIDVWFSLELGPLVDPLLRDLVNSSLYPSIRRGW